MRRRTNVLVAAVVLVLICMTAYVGIFVLWLLGAFT